MREVARSIRDLPGKQETQEPTWSCRIGAPRVRAPGQQFQGSVFQCLADRTLLRGLWSLGTQTRAALWLLRAPWLSHLWICPHGSFCRQGPLLPSPVPTYPSKCNQASAACPKDETPGPCPTAPRKPPAGTPPGMGTCVEEAVAPMWLQMSPVGERVLP